MIDIETWVVVAIWGRPSIFQGFFKVTDKDTGLERIFIYRCELSTYQDALMEEDFCSEEYHFTDIHDTQGNNLLDNMNYTIGHAEYILKYSLYITLQEMVKRSNPPIVVDEIAMQSITKRALLILQQEIKGSDDDIGFAVSLPFRPEDDMGKAAADFLLSKNLFL